MLSLFVAAALLLAAGVGLRHRIAHGLAGVTEPVPAHSKAALHSCAALDAAALGAVVAAKPFAPAPWRQRPPAHDRACPASSDQPVFFHFHARAPPAARLTAPAPPGGTNGAIRA